MGTSDVIIGVALDQSGSMSYGALEVIDGFNAFRQEQLTAPGTAHVSLVIMDGRAYTRYPAGKLIDLPELGTMGNTYNPSGSTPLYDGVKLAIEEVDKFLDFLPFDGKKVVLVFTDGNENSSTQITLDKLNELISDRKEAGWEFVFMGSGGAAWTEGANLAVDSGTSLNMVSNKQAYAAYGVASSSLVSARSTGQTVNSFMSTYASAAGIAQPDQDDDRATDDSPKDEEEEEMPHRGEMSSESVSQD